MGLSGPAFELSQPPLYRTPSEALSRSRTWHEAYKAALFETDRSRIGERIRYAEQIVLMRERELFAPDADPVERRSLSGALQKLRALRICVGV